MQFHFRSIKIFCALLSLLSAPAHRRFKSLFKFFTSLHKHKKHFLFTFLLINALLYGYNMWVVPLFFILDCFACRKRSSTYGCRLHIDGEISPRRQHTISSVRLGIESRSQRCGDKLKLVLRYNHLQTLCGPQPFWPLRNSLKSFAIEMCDLVYVNCPSEPEKLRCLDISLIQINEVFETTKLQPLTKDSMEQQSVSRRRARRLVNNFWKQLYFKNFILTSTMLKLVQLKHTRAEL